MIVRRPSSLEIKKQSCMTNKYIYVVFLLQDAQRKHITEQYKNHYTVERIVLDLLYVKEIFKICISVD